MKVFFLAISLSVCRANLLKPLPWEDYILIPISALTLAIFGGIMSGLTVGLMGIDTISLRFKLESGSEIEKYQAGRILPILKDHHLLLVTLLLVNAIALETLPLALDEMVGGFAAVIFSVLLTLFIAEVIPQALCVGPQQIPIASAFATLVRLVILAFYPISYPIARLLDKVIGHSVDKKLNSEELKTLFTLQMNSEKTFECLQETQVNIIHSAIDFTDKTVKEIFIHVDQIYALPCGMELNEENLLNIMKRGYSRVPVYDDHHNWIGVLIVKKLLMIEGLERIKDLELRKPKFLNVQAGLIEALNLFSNGPCHMAFVTDDDNKVIGIVTLEDVLKQLMKKQISTEFSYFSNSENDTEDKGSENFCRKIYNKFRRSNTLEKPLFGEFQLTEHLRSSKSRN